jgi:hypothetical protein
MSRHVLDDMMSESNESLYRQMTDIDTALPRVLQDVVDEIQTYDPTLLSCWAAEGITPKVSTHLLRYVVPYYELLRLDGYEEYSKLLAAELLSCCAWRAFDNCVDEHEPLKEAHLRSLIAVARLIDYVQSNWPVRAARDVQRHYHVMSEQAIRESEEPIALAEIWKKCSILFYPPESLERLDARSVAFFRNYINYCGLSHDVSDFISDIASRVVSLPVLWFREANENGVLNVAVVEAIYAGARAAVQPIEESFKAMTLGGRLPLTGYLIAQAAAVFRG